MIVNKSRKIIPEKKADGSVRNNTLVAVLTQDHALRPLYAVYLGVDDSNYMQEEPDYTWVEQKGLKLSYRDALTYFPNLQEKDYRK